MILKLEDYFLPGRFAFCIYLLSSIQRQKSIVSKQNWHYTCIGYWNFMAICILSNSG